MLKVAQIITIIIYNFFLTYPFCCSIEVVGKFPSENEAKKYNISLDKPIWLPTSGEDLTWYTEFFSKLMTMWPLES